MSGLVANPTLATIAKVQRVLRDAATPISRYELHKRLGGTVNYPVLEAVLRHFAQLNVLHDDGAGGKVRWTQDPEAAGPPRARRALRRLVHARRRDILHVARKHGASNVRLFGSVARGEPDAQDIDLLVDYGPKVDLLDAIALQQDLTDLLGFPVDVVQGAALSPAMRDSVLSEAVAL